MAKEITKELPHYERTEVESWNKYSKAWHRKHGAAKVISYDLVMPEGWRVVQLLAMTAHGIRPIDSIYATDGENWVEIGKRVVKVVTAKKLLRGYLVNALTPKRIVTALESGDQASVTRTQAESVIGYELAQKMSAINLINFRIILGENAILI